LSQASFQFGDGGLDAHLERIGGLAECGAFGSWKISEILELKGYETRLAGKIPGPEILQRAEIGN
jgi:hypothetical protein